MSQPIATPAPVLAPALPGTGWTPERRALFLDRLAVHGNARAACRNVGLSAEAAYKLRRRDPLFARGWRAALVLARENCSQVLGERAIEGVEEHIYYRGELIGTRRRFDSRLLLAHLARLDQLVVEESGGEDAGRFDELLAAIAADAPAEVLDERAEYIEDRTWQAEYDYRQFEQEMGFLDDEDCSAGEAEEERAQIAAKARKAAAAEWDARQHVKFAALDAQCAAAEASTGNERAACARPAPLPSAVIVPPREPARLSFPWTLSNASTSALARTLAEPPPSWATTPRSPFRAPRRRER